MSTRSGGAEKEAEREAGERTGREMTVLRGEVSGEGLVEEDVEEAVQRMRLGEGGGQRWKRSGVTLVAGGLAFRRRGDRPEVLLVQEAKESCYGKWSLPMGRVEPGEEIQQGCAREVLEEAGLEVAVGNLLLASTAKASWHRFLFYCEVRGGELKRDADRESLRAEWVPVDAVLDGALELRGDRETRKSIRIGRDQFLKTTEERKSRLPWTRLGAREAREPLTFLAYRVVVTSDEHSRALFHAQTGALPTVAMPQASCRPRFYIVQFIRKLLGVKAERLVSPPTAVVLRSHLGEGSDPKHQGHCVTLLFSVSAPEARSQAAVWDPPLADLSPALPKGPKASKGSAKGKAALAVEPPPSSPFQWSPVCPALQRTLAFLQTHGAPYYFK